ncbi:hypothetical protein BB560_002235 [Smittium megazygosporum]|uniref:Uncharacterized protein n=1 Tax=Smittium megazygosporum TaxID=133381 RepID=A0A2T9ZFF3_9FUNG|nr:hypothetical protein BB560_003806 [Smittium megazygosporum]PVV03295.1 hypothetical protein BB560_002235 [Smittium megazygosporum]
MSLFNKSKIASNFFENAKNVSLNNTSDLFEYTLLKSRKTRIEVKEMLNKSSKYKQAILNIQSLHQNLGAYTGQKFNILAPVAVLHSQKSLKDFEFPVVLLEEDLI